VTYRAAVKGPLGVRPVTCSSGFEGPIVETVVETAVVGVDDTEVCAVELVDVVEAEVDEVETEEVLKMKCAW
jgi:hypothetical protein